MLYYLCMIWLKFLLIILVAAPVITIASVLYIQLAKYVSIRNKEGLARKK